MKKAKDVKVMIRNLKSLGLGLVAAAALWVAAPSSAQATTPQLLVLNTATVSGNSIGLHTFTIDGNSVECSFAPFGAVGTVNGGQTWITVHPNYGSCKAFTFLNANVNTEGCNYEFMATGNESSGRWANGQMKISCSLGSSIVINAGSGACVATLNSQTVNSGISFVNTEASPMDFHLEALVATVVVNKTVDGFGCPFNSTGSTFGSYTGLSEMRCSNENGTWTACTLTDM
ncbi:MAG TPA: hypothetical protein VFI17_05215 [Solirubrobacterales bacterium]|nr:hypothetical protein [Solirubrobacterales bacterium]